MKNKTEIKTEATMKGITADDIKQSEWYKKQTRGRYCVRVPSDIHEGHVKKCAIDVARAMLKYQRDGWRVARKKTVDKHYEQTWTGKEWYCLVPIFRKLKGDQK